jgi:AraC-like DNA-binding protein
MFAWSPVLVQKMEIRALGFVLRKLQLNRHRAHEVAGHRHPYSQLLLYLSGTGIQRVDRREIVVHAGDLFVFPPGSRHGFRSLASSRPLCLTLDFERIGRRPPRFVHRRLAQATLNELHRLLSRLPTKGRSTLTDYATTAAVVALLLEHPRSAPANRAGESTLHEKVRSHLAEAATSGLPIAEVARRVGYQVDYLTRRLKRETGLGLRATNTRLRLEAAQAALGRHTTVGAAAAAAGFDDQNYFARWFKRLTGQTPSSFRLR